MWLPALQKCSGFPIFLDIAFMDHTGLGASTAAQVALTVCFEMH